MWRLEWFAPKPCLEGILPVSFDQNLLLLLIQANFFVVHKSVFFLVKVLSNEKYGDSILVREVSASL